MLSIYVAFSPVDIGTSATDSIASWMSYGL